MADAVNPFSFHSQSEELASRSRQDNTKTVGSISTKKYLMTRFSTLKPPMTKTANPFKLLATLNLQQWLFFAVAFCAWTWDAFDFFTVSLTVPDLAASFGKSNTDITWGITLVLMFRSVGSTIFGIAADRYGRKWPFVVNNILFIVLELGTGFCQTYQQFLAVRALFGIAMGGLYGNATATALEDCPEEARGIVSGILQQGYTFGYLLATAFARALVDTTPYGWRPFFWFAACPPVLIIIFRICLPETNTFKARQAFRSQRSGVATTFLAEARIALRQHWVVLIYMILLMTGFNFLAHGSMDLYPTMLTNQFGFSADAKTITLVVANLGAMVGGVTVGYCSQIFGRRFSIIAVCVLGGALVYPYNFVTSPQGASASAFFFLFLVQGAWGVIPIHLMELSPGSLRTFVVGTSYQLGNLASSASSTIEARLSENYPLPPVKTNGQTTLRYNYAKVMCIFLGVVYVYVIVLTLLGPEYKGRNLQVDQDPYTPNQTKRKQHDVANSEMIVRAGREDEEKGTVVREEYV